jgi:hypothetical protein
MVARGNEQQTKLKERSLLLSLSSISPSAGAPMPIPPSPLLEMCPASGLRPCSPSSASRTASIFRFVIFAQFLIKYLNTWSTIESGLQHQTRNQKKATAIQCCMLKVLEAIPRYSLYVKVSEAIYYIMLKCSRGIASNTSTYSSSED